jgi:hypothetical protein
MVRHILGSVIAASLVLALAACQRTSTERPAPPAPDPPQAGEPLTQTAPVVELWNGGIYLAGVQPFLLFAAYDDGKVLVRGDPNLLPHHRDNLALGHGHTTPDAIRALLHQCEQAGIFSPPINHPVLYPDGAEFILIVRGPDRVAQLHYHGGDPQLDTIGPTASPSRRDLEAFDRLWHRAMVAIRKATMVKTDPYEGQVPTLVR